MIYAFQIGYLRLAIPSKWLHAYGHEFEVYIAGVDCYYERA